MITVFCKIIPDRIGINQQKNYKRQGNYVKNEYENRKMTKKPSNKYSLSFGNVL